MGAPRGIKWSAPVLIRRDGAELVVAIPKPAAEALKASPGDVLNFTELPDGSVQVWTVKKSTYASLADMAHGKTPAKKGGRKK
jgi:antitoxin component of MazEF toxin-antitoxin module